MLAIVHKYIIKNLFDAESPLLRAVCRCESTGAFPKF